MATSKGKVLILGAGLVTGPGVSHLAKGGFAVTVASRTGARAEKLIEGLDNCTAVELDAADEKQNAKLEELMAATDIVVSLLPWTMHTPIAKLAVKHKIHFASTSYISEDMEKLEDDFKANGKVSFNEVGVDPGMDHMSAMKVIDAIHAKGGKVKSFLSYCGGLPCPDDNNNPFGYKFSWSPRGVLLAAVRKAYFIEGGESRSLDASPGKGIYENFTVDKSVPDVGDKLERGWPEGFECHPNGDSVKFQKIYGIPECDHLVRGTYRNIGWCDTMFKISQLGMLSEEPCAEKLKGKTYADVLAAELGCAAGEVKAKAAEKLGLAADDAIMGRIDWLGLFSDKDAEAPTLLDATCKLFQENPKFWYAEGERDMICMHHTFIAEYEGGKKEKTTSTFINYGIKNGDTAMARTVTLPLAIAITGILTGTIKNKGVVRPVTADLYEPILKELEAVGFVFKEETTAL